jgi:hypothetical protein
MSKRLKDALSDAVAVASERFDVEQRSKLPHIHEQVLRKAARRRLAKAIGSSAITVVAVVAFFAVPISVPFTNAPAAEQGGAANVAASGESTEGLGFWPYVTEEHSAELCPVDTAGMTSMRYPDMTAAEFGGAYLGWTNNASFGMERKGDDLIIHDSGNFPSTYVGGGAPESPHVQLELSRIGDGRCWWVTGVSDPDDDAEISVLVQDGTLEATWDMPRGAERADLIVVEGDPGIRRYVAGDEGATAATLESFEGPGFALVVWKGSDGTVFSASGITLPEGDSSATSP